MKRKLWCAILLAFVVAIALPAVAGAHATLLRSEPADGAILDQGPAEVRLWFDEAISSQFSSAQLFNADSQPVPIQAIKVDPTDPTSLVLSLSELPDGPYSVLYKVLSDSDGHFSQGLLVFGVGAEADLATAGLSQAAESELPLPEVVLRWLNFVLIAGTVGALAMAGLVLTPAGNDWPDEGPARKVLHAARARIVRLAALCAGLGFLVGFGLFAWQTTSLLASLPQGASFGAVSRQILTTTRWGTTWIGRQTVFLLMALLLPTLLRPLVAQSGLKRRRMTRLAWPALSLLALALVAVQALSSHASGLAENSFPAVVADGLHLLAASLWVGGLLSLAVGLLPLLRRQRTAFATLVRAGWRPFSRLAALSVGLLVATGLYSAGRQVASPDALLTTLYGRALMVKIGLMLLVGLFGLLNATLLHPGVARPLARLLKRPAGWTPLSLQRLPTLVVAEGTLGLVVLLVTGLVTASATPRGSEYTIIPEEVPGALSQTVGDMVITFGAKPNRPGQNVYTVFAASKRRPPRAEIARVILRFNYREEDVGRESVVAEEIEPGRYMIAGNYLNLAGSWQVDVVVRRLGQEDIVAQFDWIVAPPGETRPVLFSRAPLEPLLTSLSALMLLALPSVLVLVYLSGRIPAFFLKRRRGTISSPIFRPGEHEISVYMAIGSHEELEEGAGATIVVGDGVD